jgi:hypothetical protein
MVGLTIDTNSTRQNENLKAIQQHLTKVLGSVRERHNLTQLEVRKRFTLETKDIPSSGTMSGVIGLKTPIPL